MFIPTWLLFFAYLICLIVMGVVTGLMYVLGENQQDLEEKKLPDILYFIFSSLLLFCLIIFMVSEGGKRERDIWEERVRREMDGERREGGREGDRRRDRGRDERHRKRERETHFSFFFLLEFIVQSFGW